MDMKQAAWQHRADLVDLDFDPDPHADALHEATGQREPVSGFALFAAAVIFLAVLILF